ncbi:MAG: FtsQ-type POTRA domain-containing protein [Heliobacteriaceae bacterium]|jgi:cell division septal protein FtsQ|nr:FtsQ-type POTRA domain-containing protein [Heliobacteriaceae bacterium]
MTEGNKGISDIDSVRTAKIQQRQRVIRKGKMKRERTRGVVRFALTVLILLVSYYTAKSSLWFIKQKPGRIEIINNKIVPSQKIYTILRHNEIPHKPIYLLKTSDLRKQILELPPVDNVYIRRYAFPARIQIIIREKVPVITIYPGLDTAPAAFLTQDGRLIGREYLPLSEDYKTIPVLSYGSGGDDYRKWDEAKVYEIQKIVKYVETYSQEPVEYLDLRNPKNVFVKIQTAAVRLGQLDSSVYDRIARIPAVLPQVKLLSAKVKYIDLSWEKVNYLKLE